MRRTRPFPRPRRSLAERLWLLARPGLARMSAIAVGAEDHWFESEGGWRLYGRIYRPRGLTRPAPALLLVPGLGAPGTAFSRWHQPVNTIELARLGCVVMIFDPSGRGRSWGIESYGGPEHHSDVRAALRVLAAQSDVDQTRIGVLSFSLGCAAVAGALARSNRPDVAFWIDWEGPSDREIITAGGRMMDPALGHGLDDDRYWHPREAVRHVGATGVPYLRYQSSVDHAQPGEFRHAQRMIHAASQGALPWFQLNDEPRSTVPTEPAYFEPGLRPARRWYHARLRELFGIRDG